MNSSQLLVSLVIIYIVSVLTVPTYVILPSFNTYFLVINILSHLLIFIFSTRYLNKCIFISAAVILLILCVLFKFHWFILINTIFLALLIQYLYKSKYILYILLISILYMQYYIFQYINLSVYLIFTFIIYNIIIKIVNLFITKKELKVNIKLSFTILFVLIIILEMIIRSMGTYASRNESSGYRMWGKIWEKGENSWYPNYLKPNDEILVSTNEFKYTINTNSDGFRNNFDYNILKDKSTFRIGAFGDSFTMGVANEHDNIWVNLLNDLIIKRCTSNRVETYNCGLGGSDPFYSYKLLNDKLYIYDFDLILLMVNYSDVQEVLRRGGMERFRKNGKVVFSKGPWFEFLYGISHINRFIFNDILLYDELLLKDSKRMSLELIAKDNLYDIIISFIELSYNLKSQCLVVFHGTQMDCSNTYSLTSIIDQLEAANLPYLDLNKSFYSYALSSGIDCNSFYWKNDGHWNNKGNILVADTIFSALNNYGFLFCNSN
jgi:hypothetical protein